MSNLDYELYLELIDAERALAQEDIINKRRIVLNRLDREREEIERKISEEKQRKTEEHWYDMLRDFREGKRTEEKCEKTNECYIENCPFVGTRELELEDLITIARRCGVDVSRIRPLTRESICYVLNTRFGSKLQAELAKVKRKKELYISKILDEIATRLEKLHPDSLIDITARLESMDL